MVIHFNRSNGSDTNNENEASSKSQLIGFPPTQYNLTWVSVTQSTVSRDFGTSQTFYTVVPCKYYHKMSYSCNEINKCPTC